MSPAAAEVQVPRLAESISEAVLAEWLKPDGATVRTDEPIAVLETDKAAVEIAASSPGVLKHARATGETVHVGDVLARIEPAAAGAPASATPPPATLKPASTPVAASRAPSPPATSPSPPPARRAEPPVSRPAPAASEKVAASTTESTFGPAVQRLIEEHGLDPATITGSGRGGRVLKEDVLRHLEEVASNGPPAATSPTATPTPPTPAPKPAAPAPRASAPGSGERVVPMSRIRLRIAERLVQAQHTAAILTTFNEIDMTAVMDARARWKDAFEKTHGVKLGFMSFFARACIVALREIPELNAEIRGTDLVYHDAVHLGVAVGTERGLIVPVVRDAHDLSFADIEREIGRLAERARENRLSLDELAGGTFTISNGGVYGSLLSTPILNPPQSGILGMHKIERRPIAAGDQVVIRPMMYVALSYDHRIVDGEQAVTFLVRVKERLEDPERMLLEV